VCGQFGTAHWAPQVFHTGNQYVMYYTACHQETATANRNCVDVATSTSPAGPFNTVTGPLCAPAAAGRGAEAIDPSPYQHGGHRYLLFKSSLGNTSAWKIWTVPMNSSGVKPTGAAKVTETATSRMEAPLAVYHGRYVWLFVARGGFSTACDYSTDVFRATAIHGPWTRVGALLTSAGTRLCGPGGASVASANGQTYIAYHAWTSSSHQQRIAYIAKLTWTGKNGAPHVA
jgi:beta-xylosidase